MMAYRGNRSTDKPLLCHCFGVRIRRTLFQIDRLYNTGHRWLTDESPGMRHTAISGTYEVDHRPMCVSGHG